MVALCTMQQKSTRRVLLILVVSSSDEVVNRHAEEDAQFNQSVVVRLISAHFPARYGGF